MARMAPETPPRRTRRSFDDDLKAQAVRLVLDEGKSVGAGARDLDLPAAACAETTVSSRRCSAMCRPRTACRKTIRCGPYARWWTRSFRDMSRDFDGLYARVGRRGASSSALLRGCPTSTARPTARCSRRGPVTRAFSRRTGLWTPAMGTISAARRGPTTRTHPRPTRMRGCTARRSSAKRAWRTSGTC
jgi:hypothetical protein